MGRLPDTSCWRVRCFVSGITSATTPLGALLRRGANPTIVGHIAGCGVCMITAEVIATWDDGHATYWLRGYDELMFQMERWWDRLAED